MTTARSIRCSNSECENHSPSSETYFRWTYPYNMVSPDLRLLEDLATESADQFGCPLCYAEAEDCVHNLTKEK